jgi:hypothetical protein
MVPSMSAPLDGVALPGRVKAAMVILFIQVLANALGGLAAISNITSHQDHGQDVPGLDYVVAGFDLFFAVALLGCAVQMRSAWARPATIGLEVVVALSAVINLINGVLLSVGALALAIITMVLIFDPEGRERI